MANRWASFIVKKVNGYLKWLCLSKPIWRIVVHDGSYFGTSFAPLSSGFNTTRANILECDWAFDFMFNLVFANLGASHFGVFLA